MHLAYKGIKVKLYILYYISNHSKGPRGYAGDKGSLEPQEQKGEMGYQGLKGTKGDQGKAGLKVNHSSLPTQLVISDLENGLHGSSNIIP